MIFPVQERELLTRELGIYGITYSDSDDCLIIAPKLKGHPARVCQVTGVVSPCEIVCLLCYESEFVGVLFASVTQLLSFFWNGSLPQEIPADYLSDMVDLYLADLQMKYRLKQDAFLERARGIHALTRELIRESGTLPACILQRIQERTLETYIYTVH